MQCSLNQTQRRKLFVYFLVFLLWSHSFPQVSHSIFLFFVPCRLCQFPHQGSTVPFQWDGPDWSKISSRLLLCFVWIIWSDAAYNQGSYSDSWSTSRKMITIGYKWLCLPGFSPSPSFGVGEAVMLFVWWWKAPLTDTAVKKNNIIQLELKPLIWLSGGGFIYWVSVSGRKCLCSVNMER